MVATIHPYITIIFQVSQVQREERATLPVLGLIVVIQCVVDVGFELELLKYYQDVLVHFNGVVK